MIRMMLLSLGFVIAFGSAAMATTDPCRGVAPAVGSELHGPVLHVLDGRTLCVALAPDPSSWVKLELADAPDQVAWGELMNVAFGQDVDCVVTGLGSAVCHVAGAAVSARLGTPENRAAAMAWRTPAQRQRIPDLRMAAAE